MSRLTPGEEASSCRAVYDTADREGVGSWGCFLMSSPVLSEFLRTSRELGGVQRDNRRDLAAYAP